MALEAVVLSQQQGRSRSFGCGAAMAGAGGAPWSSGLFGGLEAAVELGGAWEWEAAAACASSSAPPPHGFQFQFEQELEGVPAAAVAPLVESAGSAGCGGAGQESATATAPAAAGGRRKRRRARAAVKNEEEVESQRMTHIAVERNRRRQMNEYLAALRSLMPPAYAQRGDQASVVGGAINFVKELEQQLQSLQARGRPHRRPGDGDGDGDDAAPFAGFFTFPQYSMSTAPADDGTGPEGAEEEAASSGSRPSAVADVEATMVESHANLRVLSRRRPRQLLRLVVGLQGRRLTVLHLNVTSAGLMVLYSFSLKVEGDCQLTSVDEIAAAAHEILESIHQEQGCRLE